jgi:hypothetical protein
MALPPSSIRISVDLHASRTLEVRPITVTLLDTALLIGVGAGVVILAWLFLLRRARRLDRGVPVVDWEARAQVAERRAELAEATVRAGLLPYLARLLRSKLVMGLLFQRRRLVASHREGAERAEALEERLASAHADLQEKLRSYEGKLQRKGNDATGEPRTTALPRAREPEGAPPRRNPLTQRRVEPPQTPVRFTDLLARKGQARPSGLPEATEGNGGQDP